MNKTISDAAFIAHTREDGEIQTIEEHCGGVSRLAESFAIKEFAAIAGFSGKIHDIGKFREGFQKLIRGASKQPCEHACAAAQEISRKAAEGKYIRTFAPMLEYCTAGHHTGLQNGMPFGASSGGSLSDALNKNIEDIEKNRKYFEELCAFPNNEDLSPAFELLNSDIEKIHDKSERQRELIERYAFFTRYVFSCLTDADFLDTEQFCRGGLERGLSGSFAKALELVNAELDSKPCDSEVCKARRRLQKQAFEHEFSSSIGFLNMPTGSGKTLCSIKLALEQALKNGLGRIIYVIPYTSIIEQTAQEFERIFGKVLPVLQHHSNFIIDEPSDESDGEFLARCTENWDAPLIITTNVQFFQTLYHNRSSKLRKLHNIANSVIVFDEVHMMPTEYLQPCLRGVGYLTRYLGCKAVFLSATMPDFSEYLDKYALGSEYCALIADNSDIRYFRNCVYSDIGDVSDEALLDKASKFQSLLVIVNKKKKAVELYKKCSCENRFCLSTYMTPNDRLKAIRKIKQLIGKEPVMVISTSLIEAGVDLDFEAVFRETAGLDSIIQSAGRCNREGRRSAGYMHIFSFDDCSVPEGMKMKADLSKSLMNEYDDLVSYECIKEYYRRLYRSNQSDIDNETIYNFKGSGKEPFSIPFRDYAESFKLIESDTVNVIIPNEENIDLIESLKYGSKALRALAKHSAALRYHEVRELLEKGIIKNIGAAFVLDIPEYYSADIGFDTEYEINSVL